MGRSKRQIGVEEVALAEGKMNENGEAGTFDYYWIFEAALNVSQIMDILEACGVATEGTQLTPSARDCTGRYWCNEVEVFFAEEAEDRYPETKYILVTQHWQCDI